MSFRRLQVTALKSPHQKRRRETGPGRLLPFFPRIPYLKSQAHTQPVPDMEVQGSVRSQNKQKLWGATMRLRGRLGTNLDCCTSHGLHWRQL